MNLWDYDQGWVIEWYEDGTFKGNMTRAAEYNPLHKEEIESTFKKLGTPVKGYMKTYKSNHYFAAKPSNGAKEITITIRSPSGKTWTETLLINQ